MKRTKRTIRHLCLLSVSAVVAMAVSWILCGVYPTKDIEPSEKRGILWSIFSWSGYLASSLPGCDEMSRINSGRTMRDQSDRSVHYYRSIGKLTVVIHLYSTNVIGVGDVQERDIRDYRGWPVPCFYSNILALFDGHSLTCGLALSYEYEVPLPGDSWPTGPVLPLGVLWFGLIYNTLFYYLVLIVLVGMLKYLKRVVRRRLLRSRSARGLCIDCGYPVSDAAPCPECGSASS